MGYPVIRALDNFVDHNLEMQLTMDGYDQSNDYFKENNDHLKISVATNSNTSWSKTFEYQLLHQRSKLKYFSLLHLIFILYLSTEFSMKITFVIFRLS